jgi:hypothetical protein
MGVWMDILKRGKEKIVMGIILIVILVLLLIGALPTWGHSKTWGPYPSGGLGLVLLILIILLLMGRIWGGVEALESFPRTGGIQSFGDLVNPHFHRNDIVRMFCGSLRK